MDTAKWPTFSPQSAQFAYAVSGYLRIVNAKADLVSDDEKTDIWGVASKCWRGVLFRKGSVVRKVDTEDYFVVIGYLGKLLVLLWKVVHIKLCRNANMAFAVGTGHNINYRPTLVSGLDIDDYEVIPCDVVAPVAMWLANAKRLHDFHGIVFLQNEKPQPVMVHAAWHCFWDMTLPELRTLAKELDVAALTPDLYGHLDILIQTVIPEANDDQVKKILLLRCEVDEDPLANFDQDALAELFPDADSKVLEERIIIGSDCCTKCYLYISGSVFLVFVIMTRITRSRCSHRSLKLVRSRLLSTKTGLGLTARVGTQLPRE